MLVMRTIVASAMFAAMLVPAGAASVVISGLTPTRGGDTLIKRSVVKYDDLNPADAQGAAQLYQRIVASASELCASNPGATMSLLADKVEKCRVKAVKQAVRDVGTDAIEQAAAGK